MEIQIQGCTITDAHALAVNNMTAFFADPTWRLTWLNPQTGHFKPLSAIIQTTTERMPWKMLQSRDRNRHTKAVSTQTGELVGYARWILPSTPTKSGDAVWPEAQVPEITDPVLRQELEDRCKNADWQPREDTHELDDELYKRNQMHKSKNDYMILDFLAVHPSHSRKGIATKLVQRGVDIARKLEADIYLLAFEQGLNVYKRLGFRMIDHMIQDDSPYGGEGKFGRYFFEMEVPKTEKQVQGLDQDQNQDQDQSQEQGQQ
ncbi:hypothetical protein B0H63DRAFT_514114 [Podospora didyma]|uniref:N-acetyltransferase domain-containing protein n=1 Tax=Podospora didyma TaxID=330526 RepID=A0AAE0N569_9PEZI|nr:hypothetical protein B0H63DRAFT_514114 [Podospora didyma]